MIDFLGSPTSACLISSSPTHFMSVKCTRELEAPENNENRIPSLSFHFQTKSSLHYNSKQYAYQESSNCTKEHTRVTSTQKFNCYHL